MKITCELITSWKKKGDKPDKFRDVPCYNIHHYEERPELFDVLYKLRIISLGKKDTRLEILKEEEIKPEGEKHFHIHFHSIGYVYFSKDKTILCTTLIHKI